MKKNLILFIFLMQLCPLMAQTGRKVESAVTTFNSGKMEKGIKMMQKITDKHPSTENWEMLVNMYYSRYTAAVESDENAINIAFIQMLGVKRKSNLYRSPSVCLKELISKCREAELYSRSTIASQFLRNELIDYEVDTAVSEEARKEFYIAEDYFIEKEYENAIAHYENALRLHPRYYKATLYLGDCYWFLENMDSAIFYFRKGIEINRELLEPRKYLVDALSYARKDKEAKDECIKAISIYPDQSMFLKYEDILKRDHRLFNQHWVKRGCEINSIGVTEAKTKDPFWSVYQQAEEEIKAYCDSNGLILAPNKHTASRYLEVYAWEKMLNSSSELPAGLEFARKMADEGYLDCYVFISQFHVDLYAQFKDFAQKNQSRIQIYMETYLAEEDTRIR